VWNTEGPIILGIKDSCALNLVAVPPYVQQVTISVMNMTNETPIINSEILVELYPERFTDKATLHLKSDAVPVVHAPRQFPIHLKNDIQDALDNMENKKL
jgi:hypothetical protein